MAAGPVTNGVALASVEVVDTGRPLVVDADAGEDVDVVVARGDFGSSPSEEQDVNSSEQASTTDTTTPADRRRRTICSTACTG
jgi:hypothetical protein